MQGYNKSVVGQMSICPATVDIMFDSVKDIMVEAGIGTLLRLVSGCIVITTNITIIIVAMFTIMVYVVCMCASGSNA